MTMPDELASCPKRLCLSGFLDHLKAHTNQAVKNKWTQIAFPLAGLTLRFGAGGRPVRTYANSEELLAAHDRATGPGQRVTSLEHLAPEKVPNMAIAPDVCRQQTRAGGWCTHAVAASLLESRPVDLLRTAGRVPAPTRAVLTYHQGRFVFGRQAAECAAALPGGAP
jgi:hypothetical protein